MRMSLTTRKRGHLLTCVAPEKVLVLSPSADGSHGGGDSTHAAIGARIITPDLARKRHRALMRAVRRAQLRLYLRLPGLYFEKLALEIRRLRLMMIGNLARYLVKALEWRHGNRS